MFSSIEGSKNGDFNHNETLRWLFKDFCPLSANIIPFPRNPKWKICPENNNLEESEKLLTHLDSACGASCLSFWSFLDYTTNLLNSANFVTKQKEGWKIKWHENGGKRERRRKKAHSRACAWCKGGRGITPTWRVVLRKRTLCTSLKQTPTNRICLQIKAEKNCPPGNALFRLRKIPLLWK